MKWLNNFLQIFSIYNIFSLIYFILGFLIGSYWSNVASGDWGAGLIYAGIYGIISICSVMAFFISLFFKEPITIIKNKYWYWSCLILPVLYLLLIINILTT